MKEKLQSRKFWVVVASFVAGLAAIFGDVEVDPEALVGFAAIVMTYLGGQSFVDGKKAKAAVDLSAQIALEGAVAYARDLEERLANASR